MPARPNLEAAMLQSSLDCIIVFDEHGRILEFNPAAERAFGWRRADVLGQEMAALIVPPARRDRHRVGLAEYQASDGGAVLDRRIEMPALRADGTEFPVELTITRVPGEGPPVFAGYLRDITNRKRAERRRATELAVTRVLAQAATAEDGTHGILRAVGETLEWEVGAIWTFDGSERSLRCSDFWRAPAASVAAFEAETRGRTFAPMVGLPGRIGATAQPIWIGDVVHDENFPRGHAAAADGLHSAFGFPVLLRGEVLGVVEFFSHRIEEPDPDLLATMGSIGGHVGQFLERKRVDIELRDADRRKDEFLAMLAHELRNPLAPISSALAILQHAASDTHIVEQTREIIARQLALLVRLVDDLLDVSRITLNKVELQCSRVSLAAVLQRAIETNASLAEAAQQELTVKVPEAPVWLHVDPVRMAQIVSNLVHNAIKYTPAHGHVIVIGERVGDDAVVTVRDDGIGIPLDMLPRVFDLFTQVGRARAQSRGGLGIGLSVVKDLVELHGGRVSVHSAGPNRGAEFTVRIPVGPDSVVALDVDEPGTTIGRAAGRRRRVLVVDDNHDAAESLGVLLRLLGHDVRIAHDGLGALDVAHEYEPDAALLDVGLPGISGYDLARAMRSLPAGDEMLLIAVTGWGQDEDRRQSAKAGFDHHLVKPADPRTLELLLGLPAAPK